MIELSRLYAIVDASCFSETRLLCDYAEQLIAGGITLLQYRNKSGNARVMLEQAGALKSTIKARSRLIINDRADLCLAAEYEGLHLGQDDLSPASSRTIIGKSVWLGISTHNPEQLAAGEATPADYLTIGPVFTTRSKEKPDPVVGLDGVRRARQMTDKPLVAIGGITRGNARSVIDAGADSVAVIADLLADPRKSAEEFLRILG